MEGETELTADATQGSAASYFALQATWGLTRHLGGRAATRELAERCGVGPGDRVLEVGSGVGASTRFLAREFGCEVVAVDLSPAMARWTRRRADRDGVGDAVEVALADATALPFAAGSFDAVLSESVVAFVEDRDAAFGEYARVVRPGGRVGVNEATWDGTPPEDAVVGLNEATGAKAATAAEWEGWLAGAGLVDVSTHHQDLSALGELANEFRCYRPAELARAWYRFGAAFATRPEVRTWTRDLLSSLREFASLTEYFDYGIYVGRKPE